MHTTLQCSCIIQTSHLLLIRQIQRIYILPCCCILVNMTVAAAYWKRGGEGYGKWGVGLARYMLLEIWGKYWCHSRPFIFTFEGVALYHWLLPYKLPINYFCKNSIGECCVPLFVDRTVHTSWRVGSEVSPTSCNTNICRLAWVKLLQQKHWRVLSTS